MDSARSRRYRRPGATGPADDATVVGLADRQTLTRETLALALSASGFRVIQIAEPESARSAFPRIDVLLAAHDYHNPSGIRLAGEYAAYCGARRAATITYTLSAEVFAETLNCGGAGSVERDWELDRLTSAIRSMRDDGSLRPAEETVRILTRAAQVETRRRMIDRALSQLTAREVEILRCMAAGHTGPEVAARLHISEKTERAHVANILRKLRVRSKLQAVVFAAAAGFVELTIPTQQRDRTVRRLPERERATSLRA